MQLSTLLLFATTALAAITPISKCEKEYAACQKSAPALSLLSSCSSRLTNCKSNTDSPISINILDGPSDTDNTVSPAAKKAYRKCKKEFDDCGDLPGANLSTCASEIVVCFKKVRKAGI